MNTPAATLPRKPAVTVILVFIGLIFLAPGACGMSYYADAIEHWIASDFVFGGQSLGPAAILISTGSIISSVLLVTLVIHLARWPLGQRLSLHLSIFAALVVIFSYIMIFPTIAESRIPAGFFETGTNSSVAFLKLHLTVVAGLFLGFLPPFLVWRKSRTGGGVSEGAS